MREDRRARGRNVRHAWGFGDGYVSGIEDAMSLVCSSQKEKATWTFARVDGGRYNVPPLSTHHIAGYSPRSKKKGPPARHLAKDRTITPSLRLLPPSAMSTASQATGSGADPSSALVTGSVGRQIS
ncbi:hypothetical protein BS50DRAFT_328576 [Corynespora cassiicola Philippines]|uniref:Uncharacterized protein n=1 Tax=Corynespora cassiicola Philippines TaxID=1448308 RepID=A0A2T2NV22_CORCC|nr:hypothetical protein BS50DRAFT_328576 [Corynespora cassiicola Philippines]